VEVRGYAEELLEFLLWGLEGLMRPSLSRALAGPPVSGYRTQRRAMCRLMQDGLVETTGRGRKASFRITAKGRQVAEGENPRDHWSRSWDGRWRVFSFDVPERRRADRRALYWALRERKFGLLQRSVWVWPHDVAATLEEIVEAKGIPECFVGFEASRLFLSDHWEIVASAWDFELIGRCHERYVREGTDYRQGLARAESWPAVTRLARTERAAYREAFRVDPWLPRELWPRNYRGEQVHGQHEIFRGLLAKRLRQLARVM